VGQRAGQRVEYRIFLEFFILWAESQHIVGTLGLRNFILMSITFTGMNFLLKTVSCILRVIADPVSLRNLKVKPVSTNTRDLNRIFFMNGSTTSSPTRTHISQRRITTRCCKTYVRVNEKCSNMGWEAPADRAKASVRPSRAYSFASNLIRAFTPVRFQKNSLTDLPKPNQLKSSNLDT
jgi:hypothetical protein